MHNRGNDYGNMRLCMGRVFYIKLSRSVLFVGKEDVLPG